MWYTIYIFQFDIYLYDHLRQPHYFQFSEPPKRNREAKQLQSDYKRGTEDYFKISTK